MRKHITTLWLALAIGVALTVSALAHPGGHGQRSDGKTTRVDKHRHRPNGQSLVSTREGKIYVERASGAPSFFR
ncbi:MAG: hypothetical protein U0X75_30125 [Acidobacteriota bacterium]